MNLGGLIASVLPMLRASAESMMLDTAAVENLTGFTIDANGAEIPSFVTVYSGKCRVQADARREATPVAGGATFTVQRDHIDFPVGSFLPAIAQVITIKSAALDPYLVGRVYRVTSLLHKSQATAYRLVVEETVV